MSIQENMAMAYLRGRRRGLRPGVPARLKRQMKEQLAELGMGLETRLTTQVNKLSGGQRQALSLLMATVAEPRLLLLDEHTAALDPKVAATIMDLTGKIVRERRLTTLMVTHNMEIALTWGNRLIMMHEGRIILDVPGAEKTGLRAAVGRQPQARRKLGRIVMLGTPNFGSVRGSALRGVHSLLVKLVAAADVHHTVAELTEQVFATFPGLYQLLPAPERYTEVDLFDPRCWPTTGPRVQGAILSRCRRYCAAVWPPETSASRSSRVWITRPSSAWPCTTGNSSTTRAATATGPPPWIWRNFPTSRLTTSRNPTAACPTTAASPRRCPKSSLRGAPNCCLRPGLRPDWRCPAPPA